MEIEERKNMHKGIGMALCLFSMFFTLIGVFVEGYTWYFFAIAGIIVVIMLYHMVKYWCPVLEEYNKAKQ